MPSPSTEKPYSAEWWLKELRDAEKRQETFIARGDKVLRRYEDTRDSLTEKDSRFNILYSNTETYKPLLFSNIPAADVRRRYTRGNTALPRKLSEYIESLIDYGVDAGGLYDSVANARDDWLLPGRGTVRIVYEPIIEDTREEEEVGEQLVAPPVMDAQGNVIEPAITELPDDAFMRDDGKAYIKTGGKEEKIFEECRFEYVYWKNYLEGDAKVWDDVPWVAFKAGYTYEEIKADKNFKKYADKLAYYSRNKKDNKNHKAKAGSQQEAVIYEVWCKETNTQYFVAKELPDEILYKVDDPLGLLSKGLFPVPRPLCGIKTNESTIPFPLFRAYQDQANELDTITDRITTLVAELRRRGVYDAGIKELAELYDAPDNTYIPAKRYSELAERGGLQAVIASLPNDDILQVLTVLYQNRQIIIQSIYEIIGLADIMRGVSNPQDGQETNKLKGKFGTLRISEMQREMQRFIRDLYRLYVEVVAENFEPETISLMVGEQIDPVIMQALRNQYPRGFTIDVETEATAATDADHEKKMAVEFATAMAEFAAAAPGMVQMYGALASKELLMSVIRRFKAGRQLEEMFEEELDKKIQQSAQTPKQPSPEQIKAQIEQQKLQLDAQKMQAEFALKQAQLMLEQQKLQLEAGKAISDAQIRQSQNAIAESKVAIEAIKIQAEAANPNDNAIVGA